MDDLSGYNPPCLETACHSPEASMSRGVKLRTGWQSERGYQASRVRRFRIRTTDPVAPSRRAESRLVRPLSSLVPAARH